jgi:hypothetical protein
MADQKPLKVNASGDPSQFATGDTIPLASGGTGQAAADAAALRTALSIQTQDAALDELAALTLTKGDILVHDGTNLNKLDIGSNGQVVGYNSATATGLEPVDILAAAEAKFTATNDNAGTVNMGQPVYFKSDGDFDLARANAETTCRSIGFVQDSTIAAAANGEVQLDGVITLASTAAWDAITGGSGGLTPGAMYYVSTATAGLLQSTVPTGAGNYICPVLLGLSDTTGQILNRPRIALT